MTISSSNRLLISHITLRGVELEQLYRRIESQPGIYFNDLVFALSPDPCDHSRLELTETALFEAVNFLIVADMIRSEGSTRRQACFYPKPMLNDIPFPLLLLYHIQAHPDKRQRALALVQRHLVAEDILSSNTKDIRIEMERSSLGNLFVWTSEKVIFWSHLSHYLGTVRRLNHKNEILIVPQMSLLLKTLHWTNKTELVDIYHLRQSLDAIDRLFFACYTVHNRVHQGIVQALVALEKTGYVQFFHYSDSQSSLLLNERRISHFRLKKEDRLLL